MIALYMVTLGVKVTSMEYHIIGNQKSDFVNFEKPINNMKLHSGIYSTHHPGFSIPFVFSYHKYSNPSHLNLDIELDSNSPPSEVVIESVTQRSKIDGSQIQIESGSNLSLETFQNNGSNPSVNYNYYSISTVNNVVFRVDSDEIHISGFVRFDDGVKANFSSSMTLLHRDETYFTTGWSEYYPYIFGTD